MNDLSDYDIIFLDSVNKLKLSPDDLDELREIYPKKSFIFIFQTTKAGSFRGSNDYMHVIDVVIEVPEKGLAVQIDGSARAVKWIFLDKLLFRVLRF